MVKKTNFAVSSDSSSSSDSDAKGAEKHEKKVQISTEIEMCFFSGRTTKKGGGGNPPKH